MYLLSVHFGHALLDPAPWTTQRPPGAPRYKHSSTCKKKPRKKTLDPKSGTCQGQASGNGCITHFLPLPTWGHDFPWAIVTQPVGIFQTPRCVMNDMDIIFSKIPFDLLWVEWFGHSALSKSSTFFHFSENLNFLPCAENKLLKTFFQNALI